MLTLLGQRERVMANRVKVLEARSENNMNFQKPSLRKVENGMFLFEIRTENFENGNANPHQNF